jgi:hypothetical protein
VWDWFVGVLVFWEIENEFIFGSLQDIKTSHSSIHETLENVSLDANRASACDIVCIVES